MKNYLDNFVEKFGNLIEAEWIVKSFQWTNIWHQIISINSWKLNKYRCGISVVDDEIMIFKERRSSKLYRDNLISSKFGILRKSNFQNYVFQNYDMQDLWIYEYILLFIIRPGPFFGPEKFLVNFRSGGWSDHYLKIANQFDVLVHIWSKTLDQKFNPGN